MASRRPRSDLQALFDSVTQSFTFFQPAVTESQGPVPKPGNMPRLPDSERAFDGAREALAQRLGVDPLTIQRVEVDTQEWNDACLGVTSPGEMCAQVITPGWVVVLNVGGQRYEAHTDQEGMRRAVCPQGPGLRTRHSAMPRRHRMFALLNHELSFSTGWVKDALRKRDKLIANSYRNTDDSDTVQQAGKCKV